jgi:hypothetical protein
MCLDAEMSLSVGKKRFAENKRGGATGVSVAVFANPSAILAVGMPGMCNQNYNSLSGESGRLAGNFEEQPGLGWQTLRGLL